MKRFTGKKEDVYMVLSFYFNPRSPRGERLSGFLREIFVHYISIHAPREGSDGF